MHRYDAPETSVAIAAQAGDDRTVTITLRRREGGASRHIFRAYLSDDAEGDGISGAAPSGGVVAGAKGAILAEETANLMMTCQTDAAGQIELVITEAGAKTFYLCIVQPNGALHVTPVAFT